MAQVYQKSHYDYDGMQRSERRPSRGTLHTVDRGVPYVAYSTRPDPRNESRTYVLPTPIHDIGEDSDSGSARKRTSIACSRCRRRKIKCNGGQPCQACRSAGVDANSCLYHRVGTNQTFDIDTSVGGPSPLGPVSSYSPVTPDGTGYPAYPTHDRSSSVPVYGRSGYPQTSLPAYSYEIDTPTYAVSDDSRSWTTGSRSSTGVSYFQQESPASYDYSTPISRISSDSSEPLSPLNMSTLQHSLPLPLERRLPAPNFVGTPVTSDNDIRSPISARLSNLSISGPYSRSNSASWPSDGIERRQPSIHDLAEASMMLPPVTRGLHATAATLPALSHDSAPIPTAMFLSSGSEGLIQASTGTTQPAYYAATASVLPSLTTGMLPPTNYARYTVINNSSSSLPLVSTSDRTDTTAYYGWNPTNTGSTEVLPVINTVEVTPQPTVGAERRNSSTQLQTGFPPLHHPQPKIVPSTPHVNTLDKHDRTQQKDGKGQRPSSASSQHKTSSGSSSASFSKKNSHKHHKGTL
ncbi:hypothetical protein QM012_000989 [Aureobasidium pullulans]|uniref:Zn(2)-C6 fungal-type domain-containing protein n=1 Tax=Aureobasidium pullulans TaxID=5580 RepID=A0ABR0TFU6_AURPU